jgi:aspartate 1-decarboxylase
VIAYGQMSSEEARAFQPQVVFVDADNHVSKLGSDPAEALLGTGLLRGDTPHSR